MEVVEPGNYSVLMSVYYKEHAEYLQTAIDSIWEQTIPTDDFVLVCDGPLNAELDAVIESMQASHADNFHVIRLEKNSGLGIALNDGLKHCKHEIVARMDSDDIAFPDRCERQLKVFEDYPESSLCSGTVIEFLDTVENVVGKRELPVTYEEIVSFSHKRNPCNHPSVMFKKSAVEAAGGYIEKYHLFEDYYLWVRMLMNGAKARNIKEPILYMRTPSDLYMRRGGKAYAKDMLAFHGWLKDEGWISTGPYLTGAIPHALVCVLPNNLRGLIYKALHA